MMAYRRSLPDRAGLTGKACGEPCPGLTPHAGVMLSRRQWRNLRLANASDETAIALIVWEEYARP